MSRAPEMTPLWGGTLCLDYANSVDWSSEGERLGQSDVLPSAEMLGRWGRRVGLLTGDARQVSEAELRRAHALRDAVHCLFVSISHGQKPASGDLALLTESYGEAIERATLEACDGRFELSWPPQDPAAVRYAVATDAIALLRDPARLGRVRCCPGRGCGWLFLNTSGRRRWCSMTTCGSREKMRRLHQRRSGQLDSPQERQRA